jgi:hypothetical protein
MGRSKDEECEEKKDTVGVFGSIISSFTIMLVSIIIFILFGSSVLSRIKHYNEWNLPSNLHSKPYSTSAHQWKNPPPPEKQSGGMLPVASGVAYGLAKQAAEQKLKENRSKIGSGTRGTSGLEFPYDLINGNEVGDWFSRTIAVSMSKHNGWLKFGLDKLQQSMYPMDKKGMMGKVKKWGYLFVAWIILIASQFIWIYNTTLSYITAWGPGWSNMWLFSEDYPNSYIFHNIPFLTSITSSILTCFTSTYQYLTGFAFLAFSAYFTTGKKAFEYATEEFQSYFTFKGILFGLLLLFGLSIGMNCWSECIEISSKESANIMGKIGLGICGVSALFVWYHEGKELAKKAFAKAILSKKN